MARDLIDKSKIDKFAVKSFKIKDRVANIKTGTYGPYIQLVSGNSKQNISIPKNYNIETITNEEVIDIIANKNGTKKINNLKK
jgi:topoisomerase IA-like protein